MAFLRLPTVSSACLLALLPAVPSRAAGAFAGPLVVALDPGHGGPPPHEGAHGPKGLLEKDLTLSVALRTRALLEQRGATVILTRETDEDVPLARRAELANEAGADLFVSIHCNSMARPQDRAETEGIETYFLAPDPTDAEARMLAQMENGGPDAVPIPKTSDPVQGLLADLALSQAREDSFRLAQVLQTELVRATGAENRGVRQAPFLVLWGTKMPAALAEIGFISHPEEGPKLSRPAAQAQVAHALSDGIWRFAQKVLARRERAPGDATLRRARPASLRVGPQATGATRGAIAKPSGVP